MGEKWDSDIIEYLKENVKRKAIRTPRKNKKLYKKRGIVCTVLGFAWLIFIYYIWHNTVLLLTIAVQLKIIL